MTTSSTTPSSKETKNRNIYEAQKSSSQVLKSNTTDAHLKVSASNDSSEQNVSESDTAEPSITVTSKAASVISDEKVSKQAHKSPKFPSISPNSSSVPPPQTASDEEPKRLMPSGGYYLECFLREVATNVHRNPMMSIASISTVMVLTLILGLFVILVVNLDNIANKLTSEMQIKAYMVNTFPSEEAETYRQQILKIEHVTGATFISKEEAFKRLRERLKTTISLEDLEENPLPDAFSIPVDDPQNMEDVATQLHSISAIETVDYGREEARKLLILDKIVRMVGAVILCLLLASTVLIVSNTIRLTVFARRKEIGIMQLVGAADWFIRWPFILEGVVQGVIGAGLSALVLDFAYRMAFPNFQRSIIFLPLISPNSLLPYLSFGLILIGCFVGAIGSLISVNRYLKA